MNNYNDNISLLLDTSINSPNQDKFGHQHYAEILASLIIDANYKSPYNIGLLGKWGVGKSSIKEICQNKLKEKDFIFCIDFDAWKYGSNDIKKALLKHIYLYLGGSEDKIKDELSRNITKHILELNENAELFKNWRNVVFNYGQIALILLLTFFFYEKFLPNLKGIVGIATPISFAAMTTLIIKYILNKNNILIPLFQNITKVDLPSTSSEDYERFLVTQIKLFKKDNEKFKKIAIFVDDLDRLPSEEMVEGINALRTFMDIKLPDDINIVFVLSCCEYKIAEALEQINFKSEAGDLDKKMEAKRFLDKIFQFRIDIPPFPYQDMVQYARHLFETQMKDSFPGFEEELKEKGVNIENLLCRLIHPKVQSPRQVLQIINAFLQSWWIAKRREGVLDNQIGGLSIGAVTNHPLTLAILSVLKVDFPYFYQYLQHEPNLLRFLLDIISTNKSDIFIEQKLKDEFTEPIEKNKLDNFKINNRYYELELYLKGIGSRIKLPKSLKALLLLNQDPITRQCGDTANDIQEAISFNDKAKIISLFGLTAEKKLTKDQASLLRSISAEIKYETYIINAYHTIIDLIEFINNDTNFLLDDIVNYITDNIAFKNELNLEEFNRILFSVNSFKQNDVIKIIKEAYLSNFQYIIVGNDYDEEETKELEIAESNKKRAIKILLNFYSPSPRGIESSKIFSDMLLNPIGYHINNENEGIESKENTPYHFEFSFIDECVTEYKYLLNYIGKEYSEKLLFEIEKTDEKENEVHLELNNSLENAKDYLDLIKEKNSTDFQVILGKYISSKSVDLFEFGFNYLKENLEKLDAEIKDYCLFYLFNAISNEISKNKFYPTGFGQDFVNYTVDQAKNNFEIFEADTVKNLEELCKILGNTDIYIDKSIEIYELFESNAKNLDKIGEFYIKISYEDTADTPYKNSLRVYLAQNFEKLSNTLKQKIVQNIEKQIIIQTSSLPDVNINLFADFMANIPERILKNEFNNVTESLGYLFEKIYDHLLAIIIPNAASGYAPYFIQILPIIKNSFKHTNNPKLSSTLSKICISPYFYPKVFEEMGMIWGDLNQDIWDESNNAQVIFDYTVQSSSDIDHLIFGSELFDSVPALHIDINLNNLFNKAFSLKTNILEVSAILIKYGKPPYGPEDIAEFGGVIGGDIQKEQALKQLWLHWLKMLNEEEIILVGKFIISNIEIFRVYSQCMRTVKSSSELLIKIIDDVSKTDLPILINLINNASMQFADLFPFGEERKILALSFIDKIPNIEDAISAKTICGFAKLLYTDIIKEVDLRRFKNDTRTKNLLREVFPDDKKLKKLEHEMDRVKE